MERWALEQVLFCRAHEIKTKDGRPFQVFDFFETAANRGRRVQAEADQKALREEMQRMQAFMARVRSGKVRDDELPVWARMTPLEKKQRGIVN